MSYKYEHEDFEFGTLLLLVLIPFVLVQSVRQTLTDLNNWGVPLILVGGFLALVGFSAFFGWLFKERPTH